MNKRIFIISLVLAISSLAGFAKKKGNESSVVDSYTFYGVNFSKCHTYGWGENPEQTISALAEISRLFVSEMSKYDLQKFLEKRLTTTMLKFPSNRRWQRIRKHWKHTTRVTAFPSIPFRLLSVGLDLKIALVTD